MAKYLVPLQRMARTELVKLTHAAGVSLSDAEMLRLCAVPRRFVEKERRYHIIAIKDKDAKRFADNYAPRVRRTRDGLLPMSIVVADVHHTDILFQRQDGSICTPKAIAWQDLATNRLFMTIVFLAPKEGVRQEHVVASFISMTQDPEWGMPGKLYLDNGGEFKKLGFVDDAMRLAALSQDGGFVVLDDEPAVRAAGSTARRSMVIRAQPYNAAAKPIEGQFSVIERGPFAMVPGWIAGDRMAKKTHNVGKDPPPFPGTEEEFTNTVRVALDYCHTHPQRGALGGRSPREALAEFIAAGWKPIAVDRTALEAMFAVEEHRTLRQGEFIYRNTLYRHDELVKLGAGVKVRVRVPIIGDKEKLTVLNEDGAFICIAPPSPRTGFLDTSGAKDRGRRKKVQTKAINVLRQDTDRVDLVAEMKEAAALHATAPATEPADTIRLSDTAEAIAKTLANLPALKAAAAQSWQDKQREQNALAARLAANIRARA